MIYGFMFAIVQVFHLFYHILQLADTKIGNIDKVKYFVMQNGKSNLQNVCEKQSLQDHTEQNILCQTAPGSAQAMF